MSKELTYVVDVLAALGVVPRVLFGPEHEWAGNAQGMISIGTGSSSDAARGVRVVRLYGESLEDLPPSHAELDELDVVVERGITGRAQGFVPIGNDLRTNLSVVGSVGQRGIVQLDWRTLRRASIALRTEVTNQPANSGDIGARDIVQVGYEVTPELTVAARVSYQGRTIHHAGPGTGLAVSCQW